MELAIDSLVSDVATIRFTLEVGGSGIQALSEFSASVRESGVVGIQFAPWVVVVVSHDQYPSPKQIRKMSGPVILDLSKLR